MTLPMGSSCGTGLAVVPRRPRIMAAAVASIISANPVSRTPPGM